MGQTNIKYFHVLFSRYSLFGKRLFAPGIEHFIEALLQFDK